jgi:hypothetical protein
VTLRASSLDTPGTAEVSILAEQLPKRRERIRREMDATDRQVDQLAYQIYGLTEDEIRIVEGAIG